MNSQLTKQSFGIPAHIMKALLVFVFVIASGFSLATVAAEKYAVVDLRAALTQSKAAKAFTEKLKREFQGEEKNANRVAEEAKKLRSRLQKDGAMMSESERSRVSSQFEEKAKEFSYLKSKLESSFNKRQQQFLIDSKPKIDEALKRLAKKHKLQIVFPKELIVWADPKLDLTDDLIKALNR